MNTRPQTSPSRLAAAFLCLVLGFAAVGAVLLVGKAVLVDELPYRDPSRVVLLTGTHTENGKTEEWSISQPDYIDWEKQNQVFERMSLLAPDYAMNLVEGDRSERLNSELASYTYFELLGLEPAAGRFFLKEEDEVAYRNPVAVLGYDLWQRRFGGDPEVIGRTLELNTRPYKVVGVAPKGFRGVYDKADLWVPSMMSPVPDTQILRRFRWAAAVARLKPGVTVEQAQGELSRIAEALRKRYPVDNQGMGVHVAALDDHWFGALRPALRTAAWSAALLLLLAAASAAVLLHGRASLGNAVALALAAAAVGLGVAAWAVHRLAPVSGFDLPSFLRLAPGPGAVLALAALALAVGLATGLGLRGADRRLFRGLLATAEAALAVFLVAGAVRAARDYREVVGKDLSFRPDNLLTMRVDMRGPKWMADPPVFGAQRGYLDRLSKLDGVETVAIGGPSMLGDSWAGNYVALEDDPKGQNGEGTWFLITHAVSPDYFKALGVPVLQGRAFTPADTDTFGVIVSRSLAERHWPGQNPLGKRLKRGEQISMKPWLTVVGVVPDVHYEGYGGKAWPAPDIYVSLLQFQVRLPLTLNVYVKPRPGVEPASLAPAVEREMRAVAPDLPPYDVATMQERLDRQVRPQRLRVLLSGLFAGSVAILAAAAAWAVLAGRRRESAPVPSRLVVPGGT